MWSWKQKECANCASKVLILYLEALSRKDKYLSSEILDHKVGKISGCWMNARINKVQRPQKQTSWYNTRLEKCTAKMCQAISDIFLQRKSYRSINGDFCFNYSIQLLSWLLKAFGYGFAFTHAIFKLKRGCSNKERSKVVKIKFWGKKKSETQFLYTL